jgi:hypothetical protein
MSFFQSQSIPGYNGVFFVSPDGGTTWNPVGEMRNVTLNEKVDALDATSHSSAGHKNRNPGLDEWDATVELLSIFADVGQVAINTAFKAKARIKFRFDPAGTNTGLPRYEGFGFFSSKSLKMPTAELVATDWTITGDGELAYSTQ